ncbi:uncharacterized protein THITE_2030431, partial [Thermothielavioides terrestris NRRL 8126]
TLTYPSPPESTTAILLLFHGLGDTPAPFTRLAENLRLPGVLAIAVRGTAPLPGAALLLSSSSSSSSDGDAGGAKNQSSRSGSDGYGYGYHWGDDLRLDVAGGGRGGGGPALDAADDPGFERARAWVMDRLIGEVLVARCGWEVGDVLLFGFGQGGALALGLASALRMAGRNRVQERGEGGKAKFKGVVAIGAGLPPSMVPSVSGLGKAETPVLVCCGRESEVVDEDAVELLEREFKDVRVVRWKRASDGMPTNREEALPMMQFFAERLRSG